MTVVLDATDAIATFLGPLDHAGVEIRPVRTLSGERTNIVYFNDVVLEDNRRLAPVNEGWQVVNILFALEHAIGFAGEQGRLIDAAVKWAVAPGVDGTAPGARTDVRERPAVVRDTGVVDVVEGQRKVHQCTPASTPRSAASV